MRTPRVVIVGSSVAGVRVAQSLRTCEYTGEVVLVGEELELPYDKPPLSKGLLAGGERAPKLSLLSAEEADAAGIELVLGRCAVHLDVPGREVVLAGGERLAFDDVVIATGARARPSPWGRPDGVHVLRSLADASALRADLARGGHLVVIGGGFIGSEVASTARGLGLEVTVVDPQAVPMSRVLNPEIGRLFTELHERNGVRTRFGVGVEGIDGVRGALRVHLSDGSVLDAATVVIGIGAIPNDGWLSSSGLRVDDGLVCDEYSRAVGAPRVYAVGDVARWYHPTYATLVRVEHWTNAVEQAACVAHNITHPERPRTHAPLEYVWSDQYDWKVQIAGRTGGDFEHCVVTGPEPGRSFAVLYGDSDRALRGVVAVNWVRALVECRRALSDGGAVSVGEIREKIASLVNPKPRLDRANSNRAPMRSSGSPSLDP
ncbi:NAD(P)/FAD-dependent oxidoreductase [Rhodococcus jostii]|uniref:Phthalate 3,4-dioxygenase, ferredoxin reductase subunit n=1 Tax=Rhodococcus jostii TaxID=132919 RepID=A0A1H4JJL9_RHOJO|nr:FAD-dependent oxidoreductase [Rhodococcus jostii]SEB46443.1 phthalate 3,4-dioxygenase, ferredoxin reductase subunit [Rhodococcus jostii]